MDSLHHSLIARAASLVRIVLLQKKRNCVRAWCRPVCVHMIISFKYDIFLSQW